MDSERQMYQGNWSCSSCGGSITQLPFEPKETGNLLCRDCFSKKKDARENRQLHEGNWNCSSCGAPIRSLPFEPKETGNLLCRDCFRKSKEA